MGDLGSPNLGVDRRDVWDSSIQMLWEIDQKEPLHPDLLPSDACASLGDYPTSCCPTGPELQEPGTQRRLHNRKIAQKRFRQREKVCIL